MASSNGSTGHAYLDGVAGTITTVAAGNIDWTLANIGVGADHTGTSKHNGDLADVWLDDTYLDLSQASNRGKFRAGGGPINLGTDGSLPTGASPIIFLSGSTAAWHTNKGTGGGFTMTGALTDGAVPLPVAVPVYDLEAYGFYDDDRAGLGEPA